MSRTSGDQRKWDRFAWTGAIAVFVALWNFPPILMVMTAFKSEQEILANPFALPRTLDFTAFYKAWDVLSYSQLFWNSLLYASVGSAIAVALALVPAYVFSSYPIPGRVILFVILLTTLMLPQQTVIIPLFNLLRTLNLLDSRLGLILVHGAYGMPFEMLILAGFMSNVPKELEAAARVDGCSDFDFLRYILIPLLVPAIAVGFTLNFIEVWKEYFFALIFLTSDQVMPVNVGILAVTNSQYFTSMNLPSASVVLAQLPIIALFIFAYRTITQGLYVGAVKG
jgi:ABC-type glycerol-3-phosphate transport system permease component